MEPQKQEITIKATINASIDIVWEFWTNPEHIINWCYASDDWHAPFAKNDLKEGGKFSTTMAAKDDSMSFDFIGTYTKIEENKLLLYTLDDNRKVKVVFEGSGSETHVIQTFEPENENTGELQRNGWQAILNNFKRYVESN
ncbi:SRPBCC family protein [Pedobacter mucosus]|uniref:SRPBCC family protein n=1 Tax=Pedobacter mucosus TaxID=2895286 RepID=UPI001EE3ABAB|nr:SRPBCC family protein [Pedobacter mucosus]UKT62176.1 SRPBCC family protein [Pedobacter mucosus]